jgi:hypothetical protein
MKLTNTWYSHANLAVTNTKRETRIGVDGDLKELGSQCPWQDLEICALHTELPLPDA